MSKSSRRSAPVFGSESATAVLDGPEAPESPVDASEAPETPDDTAAQEPLEAAEGQGDAPEGQEIDPSDPRAGQQYADKAALAIPPEHADKLAQQVNQALQPEEIAAKMSVEAEIRSVVGSTAVTMPDGSIRIPIIVPPEMAEVLKEWATGAGEPFDSYLQRMVEMGLNAVVLGQSVAG